MFFLIWLPCMSYPQAARNIILWAVTPNDVCFLWLAI